MTTNSNQENNMLYDAFKNDPLGKCFTDVIQDTRFNFLEITKFLEDPERQHRMLIAQPHFNVPALGGVVVELEQSPTFAFLAENKHDTRRLRQAIGVLTKIIMQQHGWQKTGRKGSLYSISKYFTVTELYEPPKQ